MHWMEKLRPLALLFLHKVAAGRRWRDALGLGVDAPLQLAQDRAEEKMAPRGLQEGHSVTAQLGQIAPGRVKAVGQGHQRPQGDMLGQSRRCVIHDHPPHSHRFRALRPRKSLSRPL